MGIIVLLYLPALLLSDFPSNFETGLQENIPIKPQEHQRGATLIRSAMQSALQLIPSVLDTSKALPHKSGKTIS